MEHTHTNKIIYLTIGVVVAIIVVLGVVTFFSKKGAGPDGGGTTQTLEERMSAKGGSNVPVEERAKIQADMSTKSQNKLSPAEQERLNEAMRAR